MRPALNPRKFRRQGGRSPLEPPDSNVQYSVFAAPRWPLHRLLFPCVTAVALSSRCIRYFSHALQPLHSLAVAFSRGGWVFLPPARTGTLRSNCQCQWAPLADPVTDRSPIDFAKPSSSSVRLAAVPPRRCTIARYRQPARTAWPSLAASAATPHTGQISWRHSVADQRSAVRRWMC